MRGYRPRTARASGQRNPVCGRDVAEPYDTKTFSIALTAEASMDLSIVLLTLVQVLFIVMMTLGYFYVRALSGGERGRPAA